MTVSLGTAKHLLHNGRKKMVEIFDDTCVLVSKRGVCHQCSGLNKKFNPKQDAQEKLIKFKMVREKDTSNARQLYTLRAQLVKAIDPLEAEGTNLHEVFFDINRRVNC